ncbi:MAG: HEAT repeat domain-containing protein, partial [Desulfuromonadales bacterium]|nr:HEAT repeat domain-containing protein [Desulfuromonadales bacterium]
MLRLLVAVFLTVTMAACSSEAPLDLTQLEAKARGGDAAAIAQWVDLLASENSEVADRSYAILTEIGAQSVPALLAQVETADRQQREYVIAALGTLKVVEAIPAIGKVLQSSSLKRRYVAAWALGQISDPTVIPLLIDALDDDNSEVRRYATRALIKQHKSAVPALIEYLEDARGKAASTGEGAAGAIRVLGDIADPRA